MCPLGMKCQIRYHSGQIDNKSSIRVWGRNGESKELVLEAEETEGGGSIQLQGTRNRLQSAPGRP